MGFDLTVITYAGPAPIPNVFLDLSTFDGLVGGNENFLADEEV